MATIKTANDWWTLVDRNWDKIVDIFDRAGAPLGEHWWSDGIGLDATYHDQVFLAMLTRLRDDRDNAGLARWFNLCWLAAPDDRSIHSWPFWSDFCDLCSETWVFDPENEDA
jgi:hypothetical protein